MRITTWNVNGIRNPFGYAPWNTVRNFPGMFDILQSDIVVMQELKIQRKDLRDDMVLLPGWDCYFSLPKHKKGYSGVGIYTRNDTCSPIKAEEGLLGVLCPPGSSLMYRELPEDQSIGGYPTEAQIAELGVDPFALDAEGRCVCLEFPAFVLFGVYSPANSNGLRDDFRYGFICALDCRIRNLISAGKRVILVGDLNVSRSEVDTANAAETMKKEGITHDEYMSTANRRIFNHLIVGGEVIGERDEGREIAVMQDLVREFHPTRKGMFTHWEQKINARPGNFGSRIDFVLVSNEMESWFQDANIQEGLMGSDHCPVYGEFKDRVLVTTPDGDTRENHILDILNPPGVFHNGIRIKEWSIKNSPAFSGKLLPEFDKRRSIKDMFKRPSLPKMSSSSEYTTPVEGAVNGTHKSEPNSSATELAKPFTTEPSGTKRRAPDSPTAAKKQKGQQSLKGFFAPKPTTAASPRNESPQKTPSVPASPTTARSPPRTSEDAVHDPIVAKDSWDNLMRRPAAPLCESHSEPCKVMLTKKKGENQGRSFWMCARPLGPTGAKEVGTQWRCRTFIWCSDLKGETT